MLSFGLASIGKPLALSAAAIRKASSSVRSVFLILLSIASTPVDPAA
ncbi:MAG: hypothetical protein LBC57_08660 [Treponema sp.]|nr:hypothetical protein [Treponema sp.]